MEKKLTKKQRNKIYKRALQGVRDNETGYLSNGLCWTLDKACLAIDGSYNLNYKASPYDCYKSKLTEYSLFFNMETQNCLTTTWEVKEIILELCVAMTE